MLHFPLGQLHTMGEITQTIYQTVQVHQTCIDGLRMAVAGATLKTKIGGRDSVVILLDNGWR